MVFFYESIQNKRSRNEDSYCHMELRLNHEAKVSAYVIADGMGGLHAGKEYSQQAVDLWFEELVKVVMGIHFRDCALDAQIETLKEFSATSFHKINRILYQKGMDAGTKGGTTLTTAIHFWDRWMIANCGDSPVYVMKDGQLSLVSEIQNVAWKMVRENKTQIGSTIFYQNKNRLMEYLGRKDPVHPYFVTLEDHKMDALLLGTDGAFGDLTWQKMEQIYGKTRERDQILPAILQAAREQGENDNQTAILILQDEKIRSAKKMEEAADAVTMPLEAEAEYVQMESYETGEYRSLEGEPLGRRLWNHWKNSGKRRPKD